MLIERWIIQVWDTSYDGWFSWGFGVHQYRFRTFNKAKKEYEEYQKTSQYFPCMYRYCKIVIQNQRIINTAVHSTFDICHKWRRNKFNTTRPGAKRNEIHIDAKTWFKRKSLSYPLGT